MNDDDGDDNDFSMAKKAQFVHSFLGEIGTDTGRSGRRRLHIPLPDTFIFTFHDRLYCLQHVTQAGLAQNQSRR